MITFETGWSAMITYEVRVTMNPLRTMLGGACLAAEAGVLSALGVDSPGMKPVYSHTLTLPLGELKVEKPLTEEQVKEIEQVDRYQDLFPGVQEVKLKRKEVALDPPASAVRAEE